MCAHEWVVHLTSFGYRVERDRPFFNFLFYKKVNYSELVKDLTTKQQQWFYSLVSRYGEQAKEIVLTLTDRGKSSYSAFIDKMNKVTRAGHEDEIYYNALYDAFELNQMVNSFEIIQKVVDTRNDLELDLYRSKLGIKCEADFLNLFVCREEYEEGLGIDGEPIKTDVLKGYVPIVRVKPLAQANISHG